MGYPTNDDPDLNKVYRKRGDKPARGRREAHRRQNPSHQAPQHPAQEDLRLPEAGEERNLKQQAPEDEGLDRHSADRVSKRVGRR